MGLFSLIAVLLCFMRDAKDFNYRGQLALMVLLTASAHKMTGIPIWGSNPRLAGSR